MTMADLRVCDYCGEPLDDDEEFSPVFIGERPEPRPVRTKGFAPSVPKTVAYSVSVDELQVLGYDVGEMGAILDALHCSDQIEVETKPAVMEIGTERSLDQPAKDTAKRSMDYDTEQAGANIRVEPKFQEPTPDFRVCEVCEEELSDL